jgi:hypothetical protein
MGALMLSQLVNKDFYHASAGTMPRKRKMREDSI